MVLIFRSFYKKTLISISETGKKQDELLHKIIKESDKNGQAVSCKKIECIDVSM